jgi:predicted LPLAT superfamily acyltransferase
MNVLVHTKHAEQFNRLLGEAGATHLRLIQVSELDPAIMLQLSQRLERGEWLAIAGDRVPLHGGARCRGLPRPPGGFPARPVAAGRAAQMPGQPADVPEAMAAIA